MGNRTISFLSTSHTHDDVNRLTADDQFTYTYDANGNLETKTSVAVPTDVTTYHWDFQDQLTQIDFPGGTSATYKYDGLGRRIEKNVNGTITRYIYDGEDIVLEYDGSNIFVARYSHGDQTDQPLAVQRAGVGFFYYQADHQGSITHLTDSSGIIANTYTYDSYGRTLTLSETVIQPFTYTGRELDQESGLYYYRARYYDPQTGRFLSEDPLGFDAGDQNLYRYVESNPLNLVDPDGQVVDIVADLGFIGFDLFTLINDNLINGCDNLGTNLAALGGDVLGAITPGLTGVGLGIRAGGKVSKGISNPVPETLARVVPGNKTPSTLGRPGSQDVFVTGADDIAGLNAKQIAERLSIKDSKSFTVIEFPAPKSGIGSPIFRKDPGFLGGGRTAGGAREFVLPNQNTPSGAKIRIVE